MIHLQLLGFLISLNIIAAVRLTGSPILTTPQYINTNMKNPNVKLVEVGLTKMDAPDYQSFRNQYYGKFEQLMTMPAYYNTTSFVAQHIPGAVYMDLNIATFPGMYERFSLYDAITFQRYIQILGINMGDTIILYSKEKFGGMLYASRAWWLFKVYGAVNVLILNGGFNAWIAYGVAMGPPVFVPGTWIAQPIDYSLIISFDELNRRNANGVSLFNSLNTINYLDARPAAQFTGKEPLGFNATGATGAHIRGAKNVPLDAISNENGLKSAREIRTVLNSAGYIEGLPTVCACNTGVQAAMLCTALATAGIDGRVYNGGITEISKRAPQLLNEY